jgi:hypothetical protein
VLASSYNPDGSINPQTYASGAANIGEGLDLESALKLQQANQDQWSPMSAGSDVVMGNKRTGQFGSTYKGTPKLGKYLKQDPITGETVIDYDAIKAESLAAGGKAKAQFPFRRPPAPHPGLNSYTPPNAQPLPP